MIYRCKHCGHIFDEDMEGQKLNNVDGCPLCKNPIKDFEKVKSEDFQAITDEYELIEDKGEFKVYRCKHCGHIFDEEMEGKKITEYDHCPVCKNPIEDFEHVEYKKAKTEYKVYRCKHCGHVYDEEMEKKHLNELNHCPVCKNPIEDFEEIDKDGFKIIDEYELIEDKGEFKVYKCKHCGHIFDEEMEGKRLSDLEHCPVCKNPIEDFEEIDKDSYRKSQSSKNKLDYPKNYARNDNDNRDMNYIHKISTTGKSIDSAMATNFTMPNWDDILIIANQLNPLPLFDEDEVKTQTIIGKHAKKPLIIESPFYISHMSFGALSKEVKTVLSKGSANFKTAIGSGEGGVLPEEKKFAYKYIFEYAPNKYSVTDENLKSSDAIEIKIGQGTKPGLGGHLPGEKVTKEIAELRDKPVGKGIQSPSRFKEISSKEDLKKLVNDLRKRSEGRPIGIKIAPGKLENDLEYILFAKPDFITIDGRGGSTASSPLYIKDSTTIPTIYALYRTRKFLDENNSDIDLVITGGLRISSDFAKALAIGADAIALATAPLISVACQQYKQCNIGECPTGVTTQNIDLRARIDEKSGIKRLENYLNVSLKELKTLARISGHHDVHDFNNDDICTINQEISNYTNIKHV